MSQRSRSGSRCARLLRIAVVRVDAPQPLLTRRALSAQGTQSALHTAMLKAQQAPPKRKKAPAEVRPACELTHCTPACPHLTHRLRAHALPPLCAHSLRWWT
jgi:hypothetical protein